MVCPSNSAEKLPSPPFDWEEAHFLSSLQNCISFHHRKFYEDGNLHHPAGTVIIGCIHFILPVFMCGKPTQIFAEPISYRNK
jgi:hypothetical protein